LIFKGGNSHFEKWAVIGYSPRKIAKCIRPIYIPIVYIQKGGVQRILYVEARKNKSVLRQYHPTDS